MSISIVWHTVSWSHAPQFMLYDWEEVKIKHHHYLLTSIDSSCGLPRWGLTRGRGRKSGVSWPPHGEEMGLCSWDGGVGNILESSSGLTPPLPLGGRTTSVPGNSSPALFDPGGVGIWTWNISPCTKHQSVCNRLYSLSNLYEIFGCFH